MARVIDKTILSRTAPKFTGVVWACPLEDSDTVELRIFNNGEWVPINGSGSSSMDMSKAIMINAETDFDALKETIATSTANKLNIDINDDTAFDNMSQEEWEQFKNAYAEEALSLGLTTENHGKVVETVYDSGTYFIRMLCEDGFIIKPYGNPIKLQEISPRERYAWISYKVIDAFYRNIVPEHVVHNLTDTIVKYNDSSSMYYIYNLASYNPNFRSTDRTSQVTVDEITTVSLWVGHVYDSNTNTFIADKITLSIGKGGGGIETPS